MSKQLSIWEWNGAAATPVLMGDCTYSLVSAEGMTFDGKVLRPTRKRVISKSSFPTEAARNRRVNGPFESLLEA